MQYHLKQSNTDINILVYKVWHIKLMLPYGLH